MIHRDHFEHSSHVNILYLHGFNSSPQSMKAVLTQEFIKQYYPDVRFFCPQLASSPEQVLRQLQHLITDNSDHKDTWHFIGSSLGGYFATYLAEQYQGQAVLINPAVSPYLLMHDYLGEHTNPYTGEVYQVDQTHIKTLKAIATTNLSVKNYLVMVQTGDEVLNYQDAVNKHQGSKVIVQQGGDHSFVNFTNMLPEIAKFLQLQADS